MERSQVIGEEGGAGEQTASTQGEATAPEDGTPMKFFSALLAQPTVTESTFVGATVQGKGGLAGRWYILDMGR